MSQGKDWTCRGCGRHESREAYTLPEGWTALSYRKVVHLCPACAPPLAGSGLARRLLLWCRCNPALAGMTAVVVVSLVVFTLLSIDLASAWRAEKRRLQDRITELEFAGRHRASESSTPPAALADGP